MLAMQLTFSARARVRTAAALVALAAAVVLPGCARYYYGAHAPGDARTDLIAANYRGVDRLLQQMPPQPQRLLVVSLAPADPLAQTTGLGRLFAEQIASRLVQRGHGVTELKQGGEGAVESPLTSGPLLPPALQAAGQQSGAQAVVWGNYAVAQRVLYVSLRLVALDNTVLAASDYALPIDDDVRRLLAMR